MRIGIDAKWYFNGPPSGHVVVKNLIDQFLCRSNGHEVYLFVDQRDTEKFSVFDDLVVNLIPVQAKPNLLSNIFVIPYWSRKLNLDILILQNFSSPFLVREKKIIVIYDVLFLDYPIYYSRAELIYLNPIKYLSKKADQLITISDSERQRLIKHGIGAEKNTNVMYLGVDSYFKPLHTYSSEVINTFNLAYQLPEKYLLYVGRINIRKNLLNLLKALTNLEDKSIKLVIVGKVDHKNVDITSYIKAQGLVDRIIFTGHIPAKDLYLFYARSTVFCFPSFAEGFGLPPLEAMRCGIPVIVSHTTSLPEVCGEAGVYVDPERPEDIAKKIDRLLSDPAFYNQKQSASIRQSEKFTWENASQVMLTAINTLS